jgi:hypothetical protein
MPIKILDIVEPTEHRRGDHPDQCPERHFALPAAKPLSPLAGHRRNQLSAAIWPAFLVLATSCGVADPDAPGRCKTAEPLGVVAPGDEWQIQVRPESVSVQCSAPSAKGTLQVIAVIKDGADSSSVPMAGVSIGASVPENSGMVLVTKENIEALKPTITNTTGSDLKIYPSDTGTDSCGVALFTIAYTCPAQPGLAVGGPVVVFSGSLFAEPVSILVQLDDPED